MADIRINSLPTTASASSSDDFLALDGATNGTRKLNAYSPTFGGNLTVSGTGTSSVAGNAVIGGTTQFDSGNNLNLRGSTAGLSIYNSRNGSSNNWSIIQNTSTIGQSNLVFITGGGTSLTLNHDTSATLAGNLTVSGTGTSSFAGPTTIRATSAAAFTPLATSALEINLPYISRIAFGENSAGSANPAITLYRTTAGAAQGTAIRLFQPNATGEFYIQKGTTDAVYGTETYTTNLAIAASGNVLLGTTTDGGQKLQVSGSGIFKGATTENVSLDIGAGRSGNGNAFLDLVGDATYTDYGLRMIRGDSGANSYSAIVHRGTGTFEINCVEAASLALKTNGTTALTLDSSQNTILAGSLAASVNPSTKWGIDFAYGSPGTYVTIANDGTFDLAGGSGMIFVWDNGGSGVSQIMCYYGQTAILWQDSTLYTVTVDTANKVNVYYNNGTSKYRIQNKSGSSKNFFVSTIRLRTSV